MWATINRSRTAAARRWLPAAFLRPLLVMLIMLIMLWVVPGAVFFSGTPMGTALLSEVLGTWTFFVWLCLPIPMLIGGLVWIIRVRRAAGARWRWIAAWVVIVGMAVPLPDFVLQIIGPLGRDVTFAGIAGSIAASTGDLMAQSVAFVIFGAATITLLTCAARSAHQRPRWGRRRNEPTR